MMDVLNVRLSLVLLVMDSHQNAHINRNVIVEMVNIMNQKNVMTLTLSREMDAINVK